MAGSWQTIRVFISSTFLDMQAERDHLVRFVFPRMREHLLQRRIHLVDVDLRWGVTSEQDASEVCREIITECRPRFLCMLGGRYGTIPKGNDISITEDEVHFGVFDSPHKRIYALFYFRSGVVTEMMDKSYPGSFREPRYSKKAVNLARLKRNIRKTNYKPFLYHPHWDADEGRLLELKTFGDRVEYDILATIDDEFGIQQPAKLNEFTEEKAAMETFIEERNERFVLGSRQEVLEQLLAHAQATDGNGYVCLVGAPGSGKSALLAHLSQQSILNYQPLTLLIPHFVGVSSGSTSIYRTLRRLCYELKAGCSAITAKIPDDPEKLRVAFLDFLRQACPRKRVVILLDGVNQFEAVSYIDGFNWLPKELPANARAIISAFPGPALEELNRRVKPRMVFLEPLKPTDGEKIIEQFRRHYHKKFAPDQRIMLLAKTDAGMPLYLLTALEELRTQGTYEEITQCITQLPHTTQELFTWILERLEKDSGFRDTVGQRVGNKLVSRFASLLSTSRYGLSQHEIADLIDPGDPRGNIAALLHLLRPYLQRRGELLNFYHAQFDTAAKEAYLKTYEQIQAAHKQLADYFFDQPSTMVSHTGLMPNFRKVYETPYHLEQRKEWERLYMLLSDHSFIYASASIDLTLLQQYWATLSTNSGYHPHDAYRNLIINPDKHDSMLLSAINMVLNTGGYLAESNRLINAMLAKSCTDGDRHMEAACLVDRATNNENLGNAKEAEDDYKAAADIARELADRPTLGSILIMQAKTLVIRKDYAAASLLFEEALNLFKTLDSSQGQIDALVGIASVFMERGLFKESASALSLASNWAQRIGEWLLYADCSLAMAELFEKTKNEEAVKKNFDLAESIYRKYGYLQGLTHVINRKVKIAVRSGEYAQAVNLLAEEEALTRRIGAPLELAITLMNQSRLLNGAKVKSELALKCASEAFHIVCDKNFVAYHEDAKQTLSEALTLIGSDGVGGDWGILSLNPEELSQLLPQRECGLVSCGNHGGLLDTRIVIVGSPSFSIVGWCNRCQHCICLQCAHHQEIPRESFWNLADDDDLKQLCLRLGTYPFTVSCPKCGDSLGKGENVRTLVSEHLNH